MDSNIKTSSMAETQSYSHFCPPPPKTQCSKGFWRFLKSPAFTLAEVLITLMILGTIAVLVIPSAIQKANDRATVVQVKKAHSMLSRATALAVSENGPFNNWDWPDTNPPNTQPNHKYLAETLSKYLSVQKYCTNGKAAPCWNGYSPKNLIGTQNANIGINIEPAVQLSNGMSIAFTKQTLTWGSLIVDINGGVPERLGYDVFVFRINNNGTISALYSGSGFKNDCNITKDTSDSGRSCLDWIIRHGNMDYKYRDVSAEW